MADVTIYLTLCNSSGGGALPSSLVSPDPEKPRPGNHCVDQKDPRGSERNIHSYHQKDYALSISGVRSAAATASSACHTHILTYFPRITVTTRQDLNTERVQNFCLFHNGDLLSLTVESPSNGHRPLMGLVALILCHSVCHRLLVGNRITHHSPHRSRSSKFIIIKQEEELIECDKNAEKEAQILHF
ncbi:hypothetical protein CROQUDRAFT_97628 [Cronartium quercuum f. sp. fusiforme G11]|uniref:Uncharacterized protein n=1 Tax=Cronartium quercuum f. sp. fusiforme G11 TaxID=708437 RepID=A0A9P6NE36_9BASI|nr:hypothetical protein CROQUDRAFT_97628 [Cronartium quercuum f. sp. fusiforme G11]